MSTAQGRSKQKQEDEDEDDEGGRREDRELALGLPMLKEDRSPR